MLPSISINSINFNDANGGTTFHGRQGYSLPPNRVSVSVDFRITFRDGEYTTLTEVMTGAFQSYDALVMTAHDRVTQRLFAMGKLAEKLLEQRAKPEQPAA